MKLIINADDFGLSKSVNEAIIDLCKLGSISSTSVMINMPFSDEIVQLLKYESTSIGLHINFTQGRPVSKADKVPTIVDENGYFYSKERLIRKINEKSVNYLDIERELMAQYQKLLNLIGSRLTHFDSHQGSTRIKYVYKAVVTISRQINIKLPIRVHCKNYIISRGGNMSIVEPNLFSIKEFGLKRVLLEFLLRMKRNYWRTNFMTPDAMLLAKNHKAVTALQLLANLKKLPKGNKVLEISVHPSKSIEDLEDTVLTNERIDEYNYLMSDKFLDFVRQGNTVSYKLFSK